MCSISSKSGGVEDRDSACSSARNSFDVQRLDRKSTSFACQRVVLCLSLSLTIIGVLGSSSNCQHGVIDLQNCDGVSCDELSATNWPSTIAEVHDLRSNATWRNALNQRHGAASCFQTLPDYKLLLRRFFTKGCSCANGKQRLRISRELLLCIIFFVKVR